MSDARIPDAEQFGELVEAARERLRRFLMLTGAGDPDDLVQQAVETAWRQREQFDGRSTFHTWLFGIARNHARNDRRKRRPDVGDPAPLERARTPRGVFTSVLRRELAERLELALGRLPAAFSEAFVLHHVEGMSFAEIAEVADVSEATARVRAHRARHLLRGELGEFEDGALRMPDPAGQ